MLQNGDRADSLKQNLYWQYDLVSKSFHWILAVLLAGMLTLGWYMVSLGSEPGSSWYFDLHKSFGLLIAVLVILRLVWRLFHKPGPMPPTLPVWQAKISHITHWLLYLFMILQPATGFLATSLAKDRLKFFGLALPDWIKKNHDLSELIFTIHGYFAWVLLILISLHILAAFKHLLINKDNVFKRMWF